jgi:4-amino-4-deoxy-L-arabinose transferase-like glycosyltransferase
LINRHAWPEWFGLIAVLWLAAFLRFTQPGVTEFKRDEASLSRLSLNLAQGEDFPFLGIGSSVGFPNSPINVYIFAIPYTVSNNPIIATLFVGFLNVLAVALTWKLARRYFGVEAALVAALLLAVNTWAVIYSRKIWAQDLLPPFVVATLFTGLLGFVESKPKRWAQLIHLPLLAITAQIHFAAVILAPISLVMVGLGWRNVRRQFWISIGIAGLLCLPFAYGLYTDDLLSTAKIRESLDKSAENPTALAENPREISDTALDYAWFTLAGKNIHSLAGAVQFQQYLDSVPEPPAYTLFNLIPLGVLLSALVLAGMAWRQIATRRRVIIVLLVWLAIPVVAFTYTWTAVQPHYFIPMLPAAFIILGAGIEQLRAWQPLKKVAFASIGILAILQIWLFVALLNYLKTHHTPGAFGTPLADLMEVREAILEKGGDNILVISDGDSISFDNEPAVWDVLLDDVENVSYLDPSHLWVIPAQPTTFLMTPNVNTTNLGFLNSAPDELIALRPGEGEYRVWYQPTLELPQSPISTEARFVNGVYLESWWQGQDGIWLMWRLPAAQPGITYISFVHGLDANGEKISQSDLPLWPGDYWQASDRLIVRANLALTDVESLSIGMYRFLEVGNGVYQNSELLDGDGRYVGQSLILDFAPE